MSSNRHGTRASAVVQAAVEAYQNGYTPVPIHPGTKRPMGVAWTQLRWESEEQVREEFTARINETGEINLGLALGKPSAGLVDVDFDHPKALRLNDHLIPPSRMETGRIGSPRSHRWFIVTGDIPATRQYPLPSGEGDSTEKEMAIEFRSTGGQTLIPPSIWKDKNDPSRVQDYRWESEPWGGEDGPSVVPGQVLATQVALVGMGAVLLDAWPKRGGRHAAYLALAGGLLRYRGGVHPWWERNLPAFIRALADASDDEDGGDVRVYEAVNSTVEAIRSGKKVTGWTRLGELIGERHAEFARRYSRDVESLAGFVGEEIIREGEDYRTPDVTVTDPTSSHSTSSDGSAGSSATSATPDDDEEPEEDLATRDPLAERSSTWASVDIAPYLFGEVELPQATVLTRSDGESLFYEGRVNLLFGLSESAKSWVAMWSCIQEIAKGARCMYLDFEDMPATTLTRMKMMGAAIDDLLVSFRYVHPEEPISDMQKGRFATPTERSVDAHKIFAASISEFDPTLIVVDGMTRLYGLHGHETNDASNTDVINAWLTSLTRDGRTTVIAIDHTGKGGGKGASPIGAHHKIAMVQGTAIRADAIDRPAVGKLGKIELTVYKDRHGSVRAHSVGDGLEQCAGYFILDSTEDGVVRVQVTPPDPQVITVGNTTESAVSLERHAEAGERADDVLRFMATCDKSRTTTNEVMAELNLERKVVYEIWKHLENLGEVVREGSTRNRTFRLRKTGEYA